MLEKEKPDMARRIIIIVYAFYCTWAFLIFSLLTFAVYFIHPRDQVRSHSVLVSSLTFAFAKYK